MIPKEILKKIRQIEITTSHMVSDIFAGAYHSVFKGQGMEFDEVREYQIGDDIRSIDWNVTARVGRPHIKKFVEERELSVMIMVDASLSCRFGTAHQLKSTMAAEIAAVLAYSAIKNNDKVGLIIFTDRIEKYIAPQKGVRHVLRVIREILYFQPEHTTTNIIIPLEYLNKVIHRRCVSFLLSDFLMDQKPEYIDTVKQTMAITKRKHDLIAITLNDPSEIAIPNCGLIRLHDAETGKVILIDTSQKKARTEFESMAQRRITERSNLFRSIGIDHINVQTDQRYDLALIKFFKQRKHRAQ